MSKLSPELQSIQDVIDHFKEGSNKLADLYGTTYIELKTRGQMTVLNGITIESLERCYQKQEENECEVSTPQR